MADNNDQQDVVEGIVAEELTTEAHVAKQTIVWFAIIILIVLIVGLFWFAYQEASSQRAELVTLKEQVERNQTVAIEQKVSQLERTLTNKIDTITQQFATLNEADSALADKIAEVAEMQQLTNEDVKRKWILSEVKFLLQMANQRLQLAGDVENARTALVLADQQLKELGDPRLYQLRALLADEQLALASVTKIDLDGLAAQLQSAIDSVTTLKVLTGPEVTVGQSTQSEGEPDVAEDWQQVLSNAWQQIRSLVVIRHQQDGSAALIVPEQRYFLYQNLQLKLESARLALLSQNDVIFYDSLRSAQQWLDKYFIGDERDALIQTVIALQSEKISQTLPDISASLVWLQQKGDL